jgi:hypothetical protein
LLTGLLASMSTICNTKGTLENLINPVEISKFLKR